MTVALRSLAFGVLFGAALSLLGFTSWDEVHRMFTFADLRLTLAFGTAVVCIAIGWQIWSRFAEVSIAPRPIHAGTLVGGMLFGAGWALSGSCPSIAFVQLGQGQLGALVAIAGIFVGNAVFALANGRVVHIPSASCAED